MLPCYLYSYDLRKEHITVKSYSIVLVIQRDQRCSPSWIMLIILQKTQKEQKKKNLNVYLQPQRGNRPELLHT